MDTANSEKTTVLDVIELILFAPVLLLLILFIILVLIPFYIAAVIEFGFNPDPPEPRI